MAIHFDTQGPAPDGFHVPLTDEWQGLKTTMDSLSLTTGDGWRINLHMPFAGYRSILDATLNSQGSGGFYWSSSPYSASSNSARYLYLDSSYVRADDNSSRAGGFSVRCFKDSYVAPTSDVEIFAGPISSGSIAPSTEGPTLSLWTATKKCDCIVTGSLYGAGTGGVTYATLYKNGTQVAMESSGFIYGTKDFEIQVSVVPGDVLTLGTSRGSSYSGSVNDVYVSSPEWFTINGTVGGAGIFRDKANGLISITSDGTTGYTIQDKNLGATTVYNDGDTLTQANMGNMYQRGNNYGFPSTGVVANVSYTQVDASGYGPGNYYSNDTFIPWSGGDWSSVQNDNLRGGVSQGTWGPDMRLHGHIGTWHMEWVPESYDYSAIQGPAPTGYHIPLSSEWGALCGILTTTFSMASNGTTMGTYLKMPMAGRRSFDEADVRGVGSYGDYWSSTPGSADYAYDLGFSSSFVNPQGFYRRSYGFSVRCFKNSPVVPDSSWTTLYDGSSIATGAGVFYNATDGLISVSGDGVTWYTIQDKNLGATTVYNQGDTLTDANCGYFYQWGNNYGFAHSGTVTTSSTQVDASTYGPGNYYSSSTFITRSSSPYDWSSVQNDNLWGGVTGKVLIPGYYKRR